MIIQPFYPAPGKTQTAVVTGAGAITTGIPGNSRQLLLTNVGTQVLFVRVTTAADATVASASDTPVLPNSQCTITKDGSGTDGSPTAYTRVAYFAAGAGSTLYVTPGDGF